MRSTILCSYYKTNEEKDKQNRKTTFIKIKREKIKKKESILVFSDLINKSFRIKLSLDIKIYKDIK
jgi:hypothetical protein